MDYRDELRLMFGYEVPKERQQSEPSLIVKIFDVLMMGLSAFLLYAVSGIVILILAIWLFKTIWFLV